MKVSLSWLKDYLHHLDQPLHMIEKVLTRSGLEVEAMEYFSPHFQGIVVGQVIKVEKHPFADKLVVAKVTDGTSVYQVVCGAPNCRPDLKTAFAREGAILKDAKGEKFRIEKRKLKDVESFGMLCSASELNIFLDYAYSVLLNDSLMIPGDWRPLREDREQGRRLYWETYGCQACHMIEELGGYLGPSLDDVGDRLTTGWMVHWLLDPQKYIPDTIEPRTGMSMQEALNVVAYLLTL